MSNHNPARAAYDYWKKLVDLLERGASIYDEDVDNLVDAIEWELGLLLDVGDGE